MIKKLLPFLFLVLLAGCPGPPEFIGSNPSLPQVNPILNEKEYDYLMGVRISGIHTDSSINGEGLGSGSSLYITGGYTGIKDLTIFAEYSPAEDVSLGLQYDFFKKENDYKIALGINAGYDDGHFESGANLLAVKRIMNITSDISMSAMLDIRYQRSNFVASKLIPGTNEDYTENFVRNSEDTIIQAGLSFEFDQENDGVIYFFVGRGKTNNYEDIMKNDPTITYNEGKYKTITGLSGFVTF